MDYLGLKNEVQNDPTSKGYGAHLPAAPGRVVELLNAKTEQLTQARYVNARTIMAECADADAILAGVKAAAAQSAQVECAWNFLNAESGIDVGNAKTQAMCDAFVASGTWTAAQAAQVKALALLPASRAQVLGLGLVSEADLSIALEAQ